jgi:two-component system OmpR family sensor kinase
MIIQSLRGRLVLGLTAVIIVAGGLGGLFTFQWAFDEAIEMQDSAPRGAADDRRLWGLKDGLRTDNLRGRPVRLLMATRPDGAGLSSPSKLPFATRSPVTSPFGRWCRSRR